MRVGKSAGAVRARYVDSCKDVSVGDRAIVGAMGLEREGRWRFGVRDPEATKDEELHPKRRQEREREGQKGAALRGETDVRKEG